MNTADALITVGALFALWTLALCLADAIGTYLFTKALVEMTEEDE